MKRNDCYRYPLYRRPKPVPPAGQGDRLTPDESRRRLLHLLAVKRPTGANAATSIRTAAAAVLVASTGRTVPELHRLRTTDLDLAQRVVHLDIEPHPLDARRLDTREHITRQLQGSDPGHLWIPAKPGRPATAPLQSNPTSTARTSAPSTPPTAPSCSNSSAAPYDQAPFCPATEHDADHPSAGSRRRFGSVR